VITSSVNKDARGRARPRDKIRVNVICPGAITAEIADNTEADDD
jgi:NAD(P)-dependent dehydrogenase (short-subunit alcohol dehydrogenase family)